MINYSIDIPVVPPTDIGWLHIKPKRTTFTTNIMVVLCFIWYKNASQGITVTNSLAFKMYHARFSFTFNDTV